MQVSQFSKDALTGKITVVLLLPDGQGSISVYAPAATVKGDDKAVIKASVTKALQDAIEQINSL